MQLTLQVIWGQKLIPYDSNGMNHGVIFTYQVTDHLYVFAHPTVDCKEHISIMIPRYPHFIWHAVIEKYLFESLELCFTSLSIHFIYHEFTINSLYISWIYNVVHVKLSFQCDNFLINTKNWFGNKYQQK